MTTSFIRALGFLVFAGAVSSQDQKPTDIAGPDADLLQRIRRSSAVISGNVSDVIRADSSKPPAQLDPDWWQATVEVETVEKGDISLRTIAVFYANNAESAFAHSPKLKKGDRGVFLLQDRDGFNKRTPGPAVIDVLDFRAIDELPKIRQLVKNAPK